MANGRDRGERAVEPVAIVGMGCRFPGGVEGPEMFWEHLVEGRCAVGGLPEGRWDAYPAAGKAAAGAVDRTVRRASYLRDAGGFDAEFFGITPREAKQMDPQQRIVLEVAWESLEHAGIAPRSLEESNTAVVIGVGGGDYGQLLLSNPNRIGPWSSIGGAYCAVANRTSYVLDLRGSSFAVDSACSSSLVAVHMACQLLRSQESDLALAGGVNLIAGPGHTLSLAASGALAADGRSKPFAACADGYGRGEGAGVLVLKRQSDAVRDGDRILALIRASGVAQDGRTKGIMAPNGAAQAALLRGVYDKAGLDPATVDYVETHGTGTPVGDPAEAAAVAEVIGSGRADDGVLIGSVKGNIGHLEAAAGVAGIMKSVLAIGRELLPATIGPDGGVAPAVAAAPGVRVVCEPTRWKRNGRPRRAGVSSFGYGGTIAHICLEEPPARPRSRTESGQPQVLVLSAASPEGLTLSARRLSEALTAREERPALGAVAHTLAVRRSHSPYRAIVVARDYAEAITRLSTLATGEHSDGVTTGRILGSTARRPVWVFSGHGAQWVGMGRELLHDSPEFARLCARLEPIFREETAFSLLDELNGGSFTEVDRIQAVLFAVQMGLARMWEARGVRPAAVIGHSVGEIAAAAVAGVWDVEDAARFACRRALLLRTVAGAGAMVMVALPLDVLAQRLAGRTDVAAGIDPAPGWSVASGDASAVAELVRGWEAEGITVRPIASDVAFHSPHMAPLLDDLAAAAAPLRVGQPALPLYSTALANPRDDRLRDPRYWQTNLRQPVRFSQAVAAALEDGHRLFLEVSAHPVVTHSVLGVADATGTNGVTVAHTLRRHRPQLRELLGQLGALHCAGADIDWAAALPAHDLVDLPVQAWQHEQFWLPAAAPHHEGGHDAVSHTLLGLRTEVCTAPPGTAWTTRLGPESRPYPAPHVVYGVDIVPAAVLLGTLLAAAAGDGVEAGHRLRNISLRTPLPAEQEREVQVLLHNHELTLASRIDGNNGHWIIHTTAHDAGATQLRADHLRAPATQEATPLAVDELLDLLRPLGVQGIAFPWDVQNLTQNDQRVDAIVTVRDTASWAPILDAATTLAALPLARQGIRRMPIFIESIDLAGPAPTEAAVLALLRPDTPADTVDLEVRSLDGASAARVTGLRFGILDAAEELLSDPKGLVHHLEWQPIDEPHADGPLPEITIVAPPCSPLANRIAQQCTTSALTCTVTDDPTSLAATSQQTRHQVLVLPDDTQPPLEQTARNLDLLARATQALLAAGSTGTRIWAVTVGARTCATEQALSQRPLWGAGRVIAAEHPELWGGIVDLGADVTDATIARLLHILRSPCGEDWLALDTPIPTAARIVPSGVTAPAPLRCKADATYVVTGGLGALGLEAARYLVAHGARRLILAGRRGLPDRVRWPSVTDPVAQHAIEVIEALEKLGVTVQPRALDVADLHATRILTQPDALGLPPVGGIVHAAGAYRGRVIDDLDTPTIHTALRAKAGGAWVLHELFPPGALDFLVLFSSTAPLVVLPGGSAYAAANSFLDGLAAHRRLHADDTKAIAWTVWRATGMGSHISQLDQETMETQAFGDITAAEALRAWEYVDATDTGYTVVVRPTQPPAGRPRKPIFEHVKNPTTTPPHNNSPADMTLHGLPPDLLPSAMADEVHHQLATETGIPVDHIEADRPFADLGLDSVMGIAIRGRLQRTTGLDLPVTVLWTHPTPDALTRYLCDRLNS